MNKDKQEFFEVFPDLRHWVRESEKVSVEYQVGERVWEWIEEKKKEWQEEYAREVLKEKTGLKREIKRLSERDGNAKIQLLTPTNDNPFLREDLSIVDFGVSDNIYVVEKVKEVNNEN